MNINLNIMRNRDHITVEKKLNENIIDVNLLLLFSNRRYK